MKIYDATDQLLLDIDVDDASYRYRAIGGDHNLVLKYSLAEHLELPVGAYAVYDGKRYALKRPQDFKMQHSRRFDYTVTLESPQADSKKWKFRNPVDGRLKFSLTAKPHEHLQMFVDNMNRRDTGWTVGDCIEGTEKLINYDHDYCWGALGKMASEFNTEFEIADKRVSLRKVEYNKSNPLPLSYGMGNGFKSGVGRANSGDKPPIEILYVQGGTENIDPSSYGSRELKLPVGQTIAFDGEHFENEDGFQASASRRYVVDDLGLSIRRADKPVSTLAEDSLDASEVYPKRVGKVSKVVTVNKDGNLYDFIDETIPAELNFEDCLIEGETMTVIFQTGMLAGREFEVNYFHNPKKDKLGRRFEIVPQEIDGETMPNELFKPTEKDTYAVFKCALPQAYIRDDATKTGASWDMFREAVKYLYDNEEAKYTFTGTLDGLWAKKDWLNIGGRLIIGGFVLFRSREFLPQGVLVRITGIKDFINNPHSPSIELSNETKSASFGTDMAKLEATEVHVDDNYRSAVQFTKRRYRDARETITMLESALLDNFTNSINPIAVQTMSMLVGDESLQFRFVDNEEDPHTVPHSITYDNATHQLTADAGLMQHLTLGIDSLSSSHKADEYRFWLVSAYTSASLEDTPNTAYYLYIKANRDNNAAEFYLSATPKKMEADANVYYFLAGVLNKEYDGERSFVTLYGFTEILPGRVTTDRVVSGDGDSYFDMVANAMKLGDALDFNSNGDRKLRIKGTIVQSPSGEESYVGCYRGVYDPAATYFNGDEVTYTDNDLTSLYRFISDTPKSGIAPTNTLYWQVIARGSKGADGQDGISPVVVYRGVYDSSKTYYGNQYRLDAVKHPSNNEWYIARVDAGTFSSPAPPDTSKWNPFGANFESVATNLLLAEGANIGDWFIQGGKIVSTLESGNKIILDAVNRKIQILSDNSGGSHVMDGENSATNIDIDAARGIIEARSADGYSKVAYMSPTGIFANRAGTEAMSATTGRTFRAAMVALGFANVNKSDWSIDKLNTLVMGVYGSASNSGTAQAVGGFFDKLYAHGLILHRRAISGTNQTAYLGYNDTLVVGYTSDAATVYLPTDPYEGQVIFVKQWWSGYMRFKPRTGHHIYDDSTENDYYDFGEGQGGMFIFSIGYVTSGGTTTKKESWLVSRWKF